MLIAWHLENRVIDSRKLKLGLSVVQQIYFPCLCYCTNFLRRLVSNAVRYGISKNRIDISKKYSWKSLIFVSVNIFQKPLINSAEYLQTDHCFSKAISFFVNRCYVSSFMNNGNSCAHCAFRLRNNNLENA